MPTRLRLFFTFLLLFSTTASWADAPIKEIEGLKLKISSSNLGGVQKPLMIRSKDQAAIYFDVKSSAALKNEVNFSKQKVLVFVWRGSGQDRFRTLCLSLFLNRSALFTNAVARGISVNTSRCSLSARTSNVVSTGSR